MRSSGYLMGVERGSLLMFSDFEDGGAMWTGEGPRELRRKVSFGEKYTRPPVVQVSISLWDMDQKSNQRADIGAEKVRETGFEIVFRTWGDTRVARIRADWLAIGPVATEDDWDIR
ncbi:MAG: H-type lectin domain-containing protein [Defluviimonas sp.]|uniref:H-type lectin domain-containing protein n=1 Tax=Albidovulum sp. TaxID=1872424 RepID=UPI001E06D6DA|nr:H-type lectin domain-containing protein [Paracoccaceae bacterium]MCC0064553.1 H-type lectin domain-containing protein [Defluviimonas sp.]